MRARWFVPGLIVLLAVSSVGVLYGPQIVSLLTHRKGAPERTWAYEPLPPAPLLRVAVVGDIGEGDDEEWATAGAMEGLEGSDPYRVLLLLGDNVYPSGDPERLGIPSSARSPTC